MISYPIIFLESRQSNPFCFRVILDLFVVIDKPTGMPTLLNNKFPDIRSGCHVSKSDFIGEDDDANVEVIAIVATYWDDYCKLKKTPNGLLKLKLEQLKLLGYHACHVCLFGKSM